MLWHDINGVKTALRTSAYGIEDVSPSPMTSVCLSELLPGLQQLLLYFSTTPARALDARIHAQAVTRILG